MMMLMKMMLLTMMTLARTSMYGEIAIGNPR
jgi:hypothetical protein